MGSINRGNGCNGRDGMANPADGDADDDMNVDLVLVIIPWWLCDDVVGHIADDDDGTLLLPLLFPLPASRGWTRDELSDMTWCNRVWWCCETGMPTPVRSPNTRWVAIERPIGSKESMAASCLLCPWLSCFRHFARRFWNQTFSEENGPNFKVFA